MSELGFFLYNSSQLATFNIPNFDNVFILTLNNTRNLRFVDFRSYPDTKQRCAPLPVGMSFPLAGLELSKISEAGFAIFKYI